MADHLLKGEKMLAKECKVCGSPLFEIKGETLCVVCAEQGRGEKRAPPEAPAPELSLLPTAPVGEAGAGIEAAILVFDRLPSPSPRVLDREGQGEIRKGETDHTCPDHSFAMIKPPPLKTAS